MRQMARAVLVLLILIALWGDGLGSARTLRLGMRGADVCSLQQILVDFGHELATDGVFGVQTERAVKQIQAALGLTVDGLVGSQTQQALAELAGSDGANPVITYTVQTGDNLSKLARRYNTTVNNIANYNSLANPNRLLPGQILLIPPAGLAVTARVVPSKLKLIWPIKGRITSGYGYRSHPISKQRHFHGGIDIAAAPGTPVRAAASGRVVKAGSLGNYGLAVVLDHGSAITTWYGHNSKLAVGVGDFVQQGQVISYSGQSGMVTGPHLDFRIKIGDQTIDPLEWLP